MPPLQKIIWNYGGTFLFKKMIFFFFLNDDPSGF